MKLNTHDLFRRWQFPLLVLTAIGPIAPSLYCYLIPEAWALSWVFAAVCLVLSSFGMLLEKKARKIYGCIGIGILLAVGARLLLPLTGRPFGNALFSVPILYAFVLLVILPMADLEQRKEPHPAVFVVGVVLYLFWQIFYRIQVATNDSAMVPAEPGILIFFLLFLSLTLLSRNRSALIGASMGRFSLPPVMQRVNKLLILVLLIGVLLLGTVPFIGKILAAPIVWAFQGLGVLLGLFQNIKFASKPIPTEAVEVTHAMEEFVPNTDPVQSAELPEFVLQSFGVLFFLVSAYFLARVIIIAVKFLIQLLSAMVRGSAASGTEDYHDEVSDVRDTVTSLTPQRKERRLSASRRKQLSPEQQIRYRYRLLKKRHSKWRSSDTVRRQLPEDAAALYERTRYGGKTASAEDAKFFESKTRGL